MTRVLPVILLGYVVIVLVLSIEYGEGSEEREIVINHRPKRYLAFQNVSRFFFRFNFKANMLPWTQIFAQAIGFRMNYDDPPDNFRVHHHRINRRNVYDNVGDMLDRNGVSGLHCVRRAICEVNNIKKPVGLYEKILKIVFRRQSAATDKWHGPASPECEFSSAHCPFSFLDIALYTDM